MRALITGADGFAGLHLIRHLRQNDPPLELHGTVRLPVENYPHLDDLLHSVTSLDLCDFDSVLRLFKAVQPDYVYHLAAQAFVPRSFDNPWETLENNIRAQLNVCQAAIELGLRPRILVVSSGEVYGSVPLDKLPITEDHPFMPLNPYSVSKIGQDMLGLQYYLSHELPVVRVRPFNHIGPGQNSSFVAPAFAIQIAQIEQGLQPPLMEVGNLLPQRDFTDVRDVVRAYHLALTQGRPGSVYNVCSGRAYSARQLLDILLSFSNISVEIRVDPTRLRATDRPLVLGSAARLTADTGWQPTISIHQSLHDVLVECRERVAHAQSQSVSK